jgi:uracil-DNA glycosylase
MTLIDFPQPNDLNPHEQDQQEEDGQEASSEIVYNSKYTLYQVFTKFVQPGWVPVFAPLRTVFDNIEKMISKDIYYPTKDRLTFPFLLCNPSEIKVVIFGQDPYPQLLDDAVSKNIMESGQLFSDETIRGRVPRATGLAFSTYKGDAVPQSMYKVYEELERSIPGFKRPKHANLVSWAEQGVLLLNTCLVYRPNNPTVTTGIWKTVIINILNALPEDTIYLLWGTHAQSLTSIIPKKSQILTAAHPSPTNTSKNQFVGCNHFYLVNGILESRGENKINWNLD